MILYSLLSLTSNGVDKGVLSIILVYVSGSSLIYTSVHLHIENVCIGIISYDITITHVLGGFCCNV